MPTLKKINGDLSMSDDYFDNHLTPKYQIIMLEDEKNNAQQDLAFAIKAYENLQKEKVTASQMIGAQAEKFSKETKKLLNDLGKNLMEKINPLLNIEDYDKSDELLDAAVNAIIEPLVTAIKPFLDLPGMPDIPLLGSLQDLLQSIQDMARIQRETKKYLEDNKKNREEVKDNRPWTQKLNESEFGKMCAEIVKLLMVLAQQLITFVIFFIYYVIAELIDLLKPVFEAFGIIVGTFIGLLSKFKDLLTGVTSVGALLLLITKLIWNKISSIYNLLFLFSSESNDEKLEAMRNMIAKNRVRIEYCGVNMNASIAQLQADECQRWVYKYSRRTKDNVEKMRSDANIYAEEKKEDVKKFQNKMDYLIKKYEEELQGSGSNIPAKGSKGKETKESEDQKTS